MNGMDNIGYLSYLKKIAHWADEFSTDAFGEMLAWLVFYITVFI